MKKSIACCALLVLCLPFGASKLLGQSGRVNVAAASAGAVASASSSYNSTTYAAQAVINGDRRGASYYGGDVWHDATPGSYPDWVEIQFAGSKLIDEIAVFGIQDAWTAPIEPDQ